MKRFSPAISFIRVIAMLSIILGHICTAYSINTYQFGGIGVEIFLFISGYLYGNMTIPNSTDWWRKRWKRLIPALWCSAGICLAITIALKDSFDWKAVITCLFCVQGVSHIAFNMRIPALSGMGQTWFLTVLVVCYILILALKKYKRVEDKIGKTIIPSAVTAVAAQISLCFIGIQIIYILQFFIGYFLCRADTAENQNAWVNKKTVAGFTVASAVFAVLRLAAKRYIDETILYDRIISRWSFAVIAIWLIMIQILMCRCGRVKKLVHSRTWRLLDMASYPLFLSHYMFLTGPMKVMNWFGSLPLQFMMFAVFTILTAFIIIVLTAGKQLIGVFINEEARGKTI